MPVSSSDFLREETSRALNVPGAFTGKVNNSANIGKSSGEFVQMWNEAHPADRIILPAEPVMENY